MLEIVRLKVFGTSVLRSSGLGSGGGGGGGDGGSDLTIVDTDTGVCSLVPLGIAAAGSPST